MGSKLKFVFFSILFFTNIGCGCGETDLGGESQKSCTIISPQSGATISLEDDISEATGIQIDIVCEVREFERGDELVLRIEDEARFASTYENTYDGEGTMRYNALTFSPGAEDNPSSYYIRCTNRSRSYISPTVTIHVVGEI